MFFIRFAGYFVLVLRKKSILIQPTAFQQIFDSPFHRVVVKPALGLPFIVHSVVMNLREDFGRKFPVFLYALIHRHLQPSKHDGDQASRRSSPDHIEDLARTGRATLWVEILHDRLKDMERR